MRGVPEKKTEVVRIGLGLAKGPEAVTEANAEALPHKVTLAVGVKPTPKLMLAQKVSLTLQLTLPLPVP